MEFGSVDISFAALLFHFTGRNIQHLESFLENFLPWKISLWMMVECCCCCLGLICPDALHSCGLGPRWKYSPLLKNPNISSVDRLSPAAESTPISNFKCASPGDFYRSLVLCTNQTTASKLKLMTRGHSSKLNDYNDISYCSGLVTRQWLLLLEICISSLHPELSCCLQPPHLWDFCFEWHCLPWLVQGPPLSWFCAAANVTNGSKAGRSWHIIFSSDANYLRDLCHGDFNFLCLTDLINSLKHVYKHNTIRVLCFRCQIML